MEEELQSGKQEIASLRTQLSRVQESFEQRIRTEAESTNGRENEVEQHAAEVCSEVEMFAKR
jgi:hypothetical protein